MTAVGQMLRQRGKPVRVKYRHFIFSLSLLTDGLLMMVEKEGRHQLLGHCFRKGRITGYLEEGLKQKPIIFLMVKMLRGRDVVHQCLIYNLSILSLFLLIDLHIPYEYQHD